MTKRIITLVIVGILILIFYYASFYNGTPQPPYFSPTPTAQQAPEGPSCTTYTLNNRIVTECH